MYATVHRVRSRKGASGFNAFFHFHGASPLPDEFDETAEAEHVDGELRASLIQVPPGGNVVDSYLDIVGPDDAVDELGRALIKASARLRTLSEDTRKAVHAVFRVEPFRIRFHSSERIPRDAAHEFALMVEMIPRLVEAFDGARPTLIVNRRPVEGGYEYSVSRESLGVIQQAGVPFEHQSISIRDDVLADFELLRGPFNEQVGALLVPAEEPALLFDGVHVVDG